MAVSRSTPDVTIIGGGIIGCTLAWELTGLGASVEILDRREVGREASWASAGILSPPGPRHATRAELALMAFKRYPGLIDEVEELSGISAGYNHSGEVDLGIEGDEPLLRQTHAWQSAHGVEAEWLDRQALREREPATHERFSCGIFVPGAGSVILTRLTSAFARAAAVRGAVVREHVDVAGIVIDGGRATGVRTFDGVRRVGAVVIAAGA